jgi:hypothetical protein
MTDDRDGYVRDLLEVCDLWFRSLDLLDRHLPNKDSDLITPLLAPPMLIDSLLKELLRYDLTASERSTVDTMEKRLRDRHEAILRTQPDGFVGSTRQ